MLPSIVLLAPFLVAPISANSPAQNFTIQVSTVRGYTLQIAFLHHILLQTAKPWNIGKVGAGNAICPNPQIKNDTIFTYMIFCIWQHDSDTDR